MSRLFPVRRLLVAALLAHGPYAWAAGASQGARGTESSTEYYAEAEHKTLVGELIRGCTARPVRWGRTTAFTLKSTAPCSAKARRQHTVAAHFFLHQDPLTVCRQRCEKRYRIPTFCGPNDPPETCGDGPKLACDQACVDAYGTEEPGP